MRAFEASSSLIGAFEELTAQMQEEIFVVLFLVAKMPELAQIKTISVNRNRKRESFVAIETLPFLVAPFSVNIT